jgi:hypothetical protein
LHTGCISVASHRSNNHIDAASTSDRHLVRRVDREVAQCATTVLLHTSCISVASHRSNNHIDAISTSDRHLVRRVDRSHTSGRLHNHKRWQP